MEINSLRINGQRPWQSLMELAKIGATERGANCRLAFTALEGQGRDLVARWMKQDDLSMTIDQVGNIFGRRAVRNNALPPVVTGSHIDTQPTGGKFDGCYGARWRGQAIRFRTRLIAARAGQVQRPQDHLDQPELLIASNLAQNLISRNIV